jgi:hypothetical protein
MDAGVNEKFKHLVNLLPQPIVDEKLVEVRG